MKHITNITSDQERAFYHSIDTIFTGITIQGPADGESAFKESENIEVYDSHFVLRYPFWHNQYLKVARCIFEETSRAPFWYDSYLDIDNVVLKSVKAFRECENINIKDSSLTSPEIGWRCRSVNVSNSNIEGEYAFFESKNVSMKQIGFQGKYSFQYIDGLHISNSVLKTKDAFWHSKNVVIENSTIEGEYLGWYSENIVFKNCHIKGTQPLCYCKSIQFINCTFEDCDLSFEYSEVNGNIVGGVTSIKNPLSGTLNISQPTNLIIDENDRSKGRFKLIVTNNN